MFGRLKSLIDRKVSEYRRIRTHFATSKSAQATAGGLIATFVAIIVMVIFSANVIIPLLNNLTSTAGLTGGNATIAGFMTQIFLIGMVVMICRWMGLV